MKVRNGISLCAFVLALLFSLSSNSFLLAEDRVPGYTYKDLAPDVNKNEVQHTECYDQAGKKIAAKIVYSDGVTANVMYRSTNDASDGTVEKVHATDFKTFSQDTYYDTQSKFVKSVVEDYSSGKKIHYYDVHNPPKDVELALGDHFCFIHQANKKPALGMFEGTRDGHKNNVLGFISTASVSKLPFSRTTPAGYSRFCAFMADEPGESQVTLQYVDSDLPSIFIVTVKK